MARSPRNLYQRRFGPRWFVTKVVEDTAHPIQRFTTDIKEGDDIAFLGPGDVPATSKLWNHRSGKVWASDCSFDGTITILVKHTPEGTSDVIDFDVTYTPGTPATLIAEQRSAGNSWTAEEGG